MNEEQLIALGTDAETLLSTEAFNRVMNTMVDAVIQVFLSSEPDEEAKRHAAHIQYRALVEIISTLRQQVSVREQIEAKNSETEVTTEEE